MDELLSGSTVPTKSREFVESQHLLGDRCPRQEWNPSMTGALSEGWHLADNPGETSAGTPQGRDAVEALHDLGHRFGALSAFGLGLAKCEPVSLMGTLCQAAQEITGARYAAVGLLDDSGTALASFVTRGISAEMRDVMGLPQIDGGVLAEILISKRPKRLNNLEGCGVDLGLPLRHPSIGSFLAVPLVSGSSAYGWLYLGQGVGSTPFSDVDEAFAVTMATQTALARENSRLRCELQIQAQALQNAQENYQGIFEGSLEGIFQATMDGQLTFSNPAMARMLGYSSPEELAQASALVDTIVADMGRREEILNALREHGTVHNAELQLRRAEGGAIWVSANVRLVRDAHGEPLRIEGMMEDITARRLAEQQLRESLEQYRLLFDSNPSPIWLVSETNLAFLDVNEAAIRHYGYSREEFLAMSAADIRPPSEVPRFLVDFETVGQGDHRGARGTFKHRKKDGSLIDVEITSQRIVFQGVPARLALVSDVTEKRVLEAQFLQAQKMESVGLLAGGVAHDFNNLLGVVMGYTELLQDQLPEAPGLRQYTIDVLQAAQRAADLTKQLLAFSRRQVLHPTVLDLNTLIEEFEKMLRRLIGETIKIRLVSGACLGRIHADANQIVQVLMNLAVNARDAMPNGGSLTIETADVDLDEEYTRLHVTAKPGAYVMLAVSDTGCGMNPEVLARIFDPFYTTKEPGKGTGLGLGTVYGIVKQSGGWIWAYSEPGRGSTFKVYLPRVEEAQDDAVVRTPFEKMPHGTQTVLVAEDDEGVRVVVTRLLNRLGYCVLVAESGEDAIRVADDHSGPLHLLITDVVMPVCGGRELATRLTKSRPTLKVLYLSGYTGDTMIAQGVVTSEMAFLQKPFKMAALAEVVHNLLTEVPVRPN